ncbi:MAG: phosphotransferase [Armatimonadota bacterium]|jgi:Ser/Thr protein kinase RdoA (MazF antagonist)
MSQPGTSLSPDEALRILGRWGFDASPEGIAAGSGTANASVIVATSAGRLVLRRRNPRYARTDWVRFDHALLAHLVADDLPVPRGVAGKVGRAWLREGSSVYELFEFIEGSQHRPGDAGELHASGAVLAALHQSASRFRPPIDKSWPRFHDPRDVIDGLEALVEAAGGDEVVSTLEEALGLARELTLRLPDRAYWALSRTVVQGDYHPANLKFDAGGVAGVFDWDWASSQPRAVDLADGLLFFCGVRDAPPVAGDIWSLTDAFTIDHQRVDHFLSGYASRTDLSSAEIQALPDLMRCRWLYCRVDAAQRKVIPERRVEFVARDLQTPLRGIDALEAKLIGQ